MKQAVGLVEVKGLASAINVVDTMLKVATVTLLGLEKAKGNGWMTIQVMGDVGAVKASVDAGKSVSMEQDSYVSSLVIPRPADNLEKLFLNQIEKKQTKEEIIIKDDNKLPVEIEKIAKPIKGKDQSKEDKSKAAIDTKKSKKTKK